MSFALTGLSVMQYMWIKNAIEVKRENFYTLVEKSLTDVVELIDKKETVLFWQEDLTAFTNKNDVYDLSNQLDIALLDSSRHWFRTKTVIDNDSNYYKITTSNLKNKYVGHGDEQFKDLKLLNNNRIYVDIFTKKFKRREINLKERIDKNTLEAVINKVFQNNSIKRKYEYAVVKERNKTIFASKNFNIETKPKLFHKNLFPNDKETEDIIKTKYKLLMYFPKSPTRLEAMPWIIITSVFLILVVVFIFALTIYIIFKQKRLSEIKNDFINNMTHELKTPISTISLASQMLKDSSVSKNDVDYNQISDIIDTESRRLGVHVEKVLQMAIIDKEGAKLKCHSININDLMEQLVSGIRLKVNEKDGEISLQLNATSPIVFGDETHISNMFINLIDNAIKYSKRKPIIEIRTYNLNKNVVVIVKDNGIGIKKENQKKVFDKFYRVHTGNVHDVKGFGLGLSYVKKIVEQHKGSINLKSEKDKGSEFMVTLPVTHVK